MDFGGFAWVLVRELKFGGLIEKKNRTGVSKLHLVVVIAGHGYLRHYW
jgi:hypothetical protein